jgi:hypothetical protein
MFEARARGSGGNSPCESLFRALGYKHNVWPMQRLGELRRAGSRDARGPRLAGSASD